MVRLPTNIWIYSWTVNYDVILNVVIIHDLSFKLSTKTELILIKGRSAEDG